MSQLTANDVTIRARALRVADIARTHAADVDHNARFPHEAIDALRDERLLGMMIDPTEGGEGGTLSTVGDVCEILGRACASTAMIFAMHQIQAAGLLRHGGSGLAPYRRRIADEQLLIASATTEIGIGGDIRRSTCAVEAGGDGTFVLRKNAPVISYGAHADMYAVTARRHTEAAPNDQVIVYGTAEDVSLEPTSNWDTLGFRGTCSPGFMLTITASTEAIVPEPFDQVSSHTMLPCSHILWGHVWLGIAHQAMKEARGFVQALARRTPDSPPPSALRLAEAQIALDTFAARVHLAAQTYDALTPGAPELDSISYASSMNGLKVAASSAVVDIVTRAMVIVGIQAYRRDSAFTLERAYRDAIGSQLMVNNDRILATTSSLELVNRGGS